jgi:hypothetical protein
LQHGNAAELHLLFATGKRPDCDAIRDFVSHHPAVVLSHDSTPPAEAGADTVWPGQPVWLELLRYGLTFDVVGLAPGPQSAFPEVVHRFDLAELPQAERFESITITPGPHLAAAGGSLPVMKAMLALACDFTRHFDHLEAICWVPSRSAIGRRYFESVVAAWLEGGPFPALGLTAFVEADGGALESVGLDYWIGQELRIEPPLGGDKVAATRLGIRIINHLVLTGGLTAMDRITAPDGSRLVMEPLPRLKTIRVWHE